MIPIWYLTFWLLVLGYVEMAFGGHVFIGRLYQHHDAFVEMDAG